MSEPKVVRYNGLEQDNLGAYVFYDDYARLAARVEDLEKSEAGLERMLECAGAENQRLLEALEYSRNMEMKDGNISGEYFQVVDEALKEKS